MSSDVIEVAAPPIERRRAGWKRHAASVAGLAISGALLFGLYRTLDMRLIGDVLMHADRPWLVVSIGLILPITVLRAFRFLWVAPAGALPGVGEALRLTLVASALNVFVPGKAGDLSKSYFVARRSDTSAGVAVAIVVYERLCDLFGLIFWCMVGWVLGRPQTSVVPASFWPLLGVIGAVCALFIMSERAANVARTVVISAFPRGKLLRLQKVVDGWPDLLQVLHGRRRFIVSFSLALWLAHLFQIWMFTVALSVEIPFTMCASLSAVALMAGQLPLTFAGLGTRDVALVLLLSGYMPAETAAAMGVLIATRGLVPAVLGAPLIRPYLASVARRSMARA